MSSTVDVRPGATMVEELFPKGIADFFAGLGGTALAVERALGRPTDFAVNHWDKAIEYHSKNHPHVDHFQTDAWDRSALDYGTGREWGLGIFTPDCRHFSRARGAAPVSKRVRSLAWVLVKWLKKHRADGFIMENVREFMDWGPTRPKKNSRGKILFDEEGRMLLEPIPERKGESFRSFISMIKKLGYEVDYWILDAADYGVPQHRNRFIMVGKRDGTPIVKPPAEYGMIEVPCDGGRQLKPYRTAAEIIDFDLPMRSIFGRKKPHAPNTHRRICMGIWRFLIKSQKPFIVKINHGGDHFRGQPLDKPSSVIDGSRGQALVSGFLSTSGYGERPGQAPRVQSVEQPSNTVVAGGSKAAFVGAAVVGVGGRAGQSNPTGMGDPLGAQTGKADKAVVGAAIIGTGGGEYAAKPKSLDDPSGTIISEDRHACVAASMLRIGQTGGNGDYVNSVEAPLGSLVTKQEHIVTAAHIVQFYGGMVGKEVEKPLPLVTGTDHNAVSCAFLSHANFGDKQVSSLDEPSRAVVSGGGHHMLTCLHLVKWRGDSAGSDLNAPSPTVTSGQGAARPAGAAHALGLGGISMIRMNHGDVQWFPVDEPTRAVTGQTNKTGVTMAMLNKYYSNGGQWQDLDDSLHTIRTKDSFSLISVNGRPMLNLTLGEVVGAFRVGRLMMRYCTNDDPYAIQPKNRRQLRDKLRACRRARKGRECFQPVWVAVGRRAIPIATATVEGMLHAIVGIFLRMLKPRELARAQSFPDNYVLPKTEHLATKLIGNAVPPELLRAVIEANFSHLKAKKVHVA